MNPIFHPSYANLHHRELLAQSEELRCLAALRRRAKAARLTRRAAALNRRAAALVENAHS